MGLQVNVTKVWLTLSSIIVALSFAFSNTIMNLFNSVILLFVVHPFDVGDALLIATNTTASGASEYVVVEELSLQVRISNKQSCTHHQAISRYILATGKAAHATVLSAGTS